MSDEPKTRSEIWRQIAEQRQRDLEEAGRRAEAREGQVPAGHVRTYGFRVWSQGPWDPADGPDPFKHRDANGFPIVTSKREIDEAVARSEGGLTYDRNR